MQPRGSMPASASDSSGWAIGWTVFAAVMMVTGAWKGAGVFNMEQLDPDPFLADVAKRGLPWHVEER